MSKYYEAHITIEPVFDEQLEVVKRIAPIYGFKVAELLMKKRENDTEKRSKYDTFMTAHSSNYENIQLKIYSAVAALKQQGFKVWRYKIEDVVMDSRFKDELNLL